MLTLDNATFAQICAFGIISDNLNKSIDIYDRAIEASYNTDRPEFVYCWIDNGLCVEMRGGKAYGTSPEKATHFDRHVPRAFTNGLGKKATWMSRRRALEINRNRAEQCLADLYAQIKA